MLCHAYACNRVLEHHGILTARLYDDCRRRGMAIDVRAGIHRLAEGLISLDSSLIAECKITVDRMLAARSGAPVRASRFPSATARSFRSRPYGQPPPSFDQPKRSTSSGVEPSNPPPAFKATGSSTSRSYFFILSFFMPHSVGPTFFPGTTQVFHSLLPLAQLQIGFSLSHVRHLLCPSLLNAPGWLLPSTPCLPPTVSPPPFSNSSRLSASGEPQLIVLLECDFLCTPCSARLNLALYPSSLGGLPCKLFVPPPPVLTQRLWTLGDLSSPGLNLPLSVRCRLRPP